MRTTEEDLESFQQFALERLRTRRLTIDQLFEEWWHQHSPEEDDVQAIAEALEDMDAGDTGRPYEEFATELRKKYDLK